MAVKKAQKKSTTPLWPFIVGAAVILIALVVVAVLSLRIAPQEHDFIKNVPQTATELVYNDILSQPFVSTNVTVLGVRLGDNEETVFAALGQASPVEKFDFGQIQNWHYKTDPSMNESAVVYHFEDGVVTRISWGRSLNSYLQGNSTVGLEKEDIYATQGAPERAYDIPFGRFLVYNNAGLEVYLDRYGINQYALVMPNRRLPSTTPVQENKTQHTVLEVTLPALLSDTTTSCDYPTEAMNLASGECKEFASYCDKPDHWVEVNNCKQQKRILP